MKSDLEWIIKLPIPCPDCGHESMEVVGNLKTRDEFPCERCRTSIDLTSDEWRAYVNEFAEALTHIRSAYDKLG